MKHDTLFFAFVLIFAISSTFGLLYLIQLNSEAGYNVLYPDGTLVWKVINPIKSKYSLNGIVYILTIALGIGVFIFLFSRNNESDEIYDSEHLDNSVEIGDGKTTDSHLLHEPNSYKDDVVNGYGKISLKAVEKFCREYPESAIKFVFRKNLMGKDLDSSTLSVYRGWEKRGMTIEMAKETIMKILNIPYLSTETDLGALQINLIRKIELDSRLKSQ